MEPWATGSGGYFIAASQDAGRGWRRHALQYPGPSPVVGDAVEGRPPSGRFEPCYDRGPRWPPPPQPSPPLPPCADGADESLLSHWQSRDSYHDPAAAASRLAQRPLVVAASPRAARSEKLYNEAWARAVKGEALGDGGRAERGPDSQDRASSAVDCEALPAASGAKAGHGCAGELVEEREEGELEEGEIEDAADDVDDGSSASAPSSHRSPPLLREAAWSEEPLTPASLRKEPNLSPAHSRSVQDWHGDRGRSAYGWRSFESNSSFDDRQRPSSIQYRRSHRHDVKHEAIPNGVNLGGSRQRERDDEGGREPPPLADISWQKAERHQTDEEVTAQEEARPLEVAKLVQAAADAVRSTSIKDAQKALVEVCRQLQQALTALKVALGLLFPDAKEPMQGDVPDKVVAVSRQAFAGIRAAFAVANTAAGKEQLHDDPKALSSLLELASGSPGKLFTKKQAQEVSAMLQGWSTTKERAKVAGDSTGGKADSWQQQAKLQLPAIDVRPLSQEINAKAEGDGGLRHGIDTNANQADASDTAALAAAAYAYARRQAGRPQAVVNSGVYLSLPFASGRARPDSAYIDGGAVWRPPSPLRVQASPAAWALPQSGEEAASPTGLAEYDWQQLQPVASRAAFDSVPAHGPVQPPPPLPPPLLPAAAVPEAAFLLYSAAAPKPIQRPPVPSQPTLQPPPSIQDGGMHAALPVAVLDRPLYMMPEQNFAAATLIRGHESLTSASTRIAAASTRIAGVHSLAPEAAEDVKPSDAREEWRSGPTDGQQAAKRPRLELAGEGETAGSRPDAQQRPAAEQDRQRPKSRDPRLELASERAEASSGCYKHGAQQTSAVELDGLRSKSKDPRLAMRKALQPDNQLKSKSPLVPPRPSSPILVPPELVEVGVRTSASRSAGPADSGRPGDAVSLHAPAEGFVAASSSSMAEASLSHDHMGMPAGHNEAQPQDAGTADAITATNEAALGKERQRRLKEQASILGRGKLVLVLDLDHTLLNSAKFGEIELAWDQKLRAIESAGRLQLGRKRELHSFTHIAMWTKLRPGIWRFLIRASQLYELHVYTMGNRAYATEMARLLDPTGELFAGRIISKGDSVEGDTAQDNVNNEGEMELESRPSQQKSKDLDGVLGMESAVLIVDDSARMWPHHALNLIVVERYIFFPSSRRQFGLWGPSLLELGHDEREADSCLAITLSVLERIHWSFFADPSHVNDADVRSLLALVQRAVLGGTRLLFSRVFPVSPVGDASPHMHAVWRIAEQFGAVCTTEQDDRVTHVVANSLGTEKVRWALATGKFVVRPAWIEASAILYRRADEREFRVPP
eukprot:SM000026S08966  [mRNA]  locus=s26:765347:771773:- [translate_table: standard]